MSRQILVVDNDPKNLKILESNLLEAKYDVEHADSDAEAIKRIRENRYDLVLSELVGPGIDGYHLLKHIQRESQNPNLPVVFLTPKSDVWNRVKSLKLGAKDYIVKPIHVREIVARVDMVLSRMEYIDEDQLLSPKKVTGRLEDLSIMDLIEIFGVEKKTGILSVYNENGHNGQIYFEDGHVINARTSSLRGEEGIYKMMNWVRGRFSMLFCDVDENDEISISNMGVLLQGAKRMELRNELLKQLPSLDAVVITTSNFKRILSQKDITPDLKDFLELFDGERTLGRVIDDCHENEIVALKRILKLYKLGFLHVLRNFSAEEPVQFESSYQPFESELTNDEPEYDNSDAMLKYDSEPALNGQGSRNAKIEDAKAADPFANNNGSADASKDPFHDFNSEPESPSKPVAPKRDKSEAMFSKAKRSILVFGGSSSARGHIVNELADGKSAKTDLDLPEMTDIYYGTAEFRGGNLLNIVSFSVEKEFNTFMQYFADTALGYVLLIDPTQVNWNYYRYLLQVLQSRLSAPFLVVLLNAEHAIVDKAEIARKLSIESNKINAIYTEYQSKDARKILFTLLQNYYRTDTSKRYQAAGRATTLTK